MSTDDGKEDADELISSFVQHWQARFAKKPEDYIGHIYFLRFRELVKIGWSQNLEKRLSIFHDVLPDEVTYIHTIPVNHVLRAEAWLHLKFEKKRKRREWFSLDASDIEFVKGLNPDYYET